MDRSRLLKFLLPYLWPKDNPRLRWYLVVAFVFMVAAKVSTTLVPLAYKAMVDALSGETAKMLAVPLGLIVAYGVARVGGALFEELRNVMFIHVSQNATRLLGVRVFRQLHALSLRFHLERQTGGLSLSIERGTQAVSTVLSRLLFSIVPILFELSLVTAIMWHMLNGWFALAILTTVGCYILFTVLAVSWRTRFRRELNRANADANSKSIDSLLNYETVKYFGNEEFEAERFDLSRRLYEYAAIKNQFSFTAINLGQTAIISIGLIVMMTMAARGITQGTMTVGDFVLVNAYLLQLYQPLNFFGFIYSEVRQALIDMENMFDLLQEPREIVDNPDAQPLRLDRGEVRFDAVSFGYDTRRPILKQVSFTIPAGHTVAVVGASGAGKSTLLMSIFGQPRIAGGQILFRGEDISRRSTHFVASSGIAQAPEGRRIFPDMSVEENLLMGTITVGNRYLEEDLPRMFELFPRLKERRNQRAMTMSGGEQQMLAIARALMSRPKLLLLDEPSLGLAPIVVRQIFGVLRELTRSGMTLFLVEQNANHALKLSDRGYVMVNGQIRLTGSGEELLNDPEVRKAYLGGG
ncbi:ABC transporter transmembrane domain-containing protein [Serratia marcescens]|uniref:ABC transporter transmembrane domain-containing protein n=1 Tax=Serratia marcescens TaxID=615 RepID=UPI0013DFF53C|nr:ABC transporter transmembrane domain-containing protein [Serratia marcescens]